MKQHAARLLVLGLVALAGCATRFATPPPMNPAPAKTLGSYKTVQLKPLDIAASVKGNEPKVEQWVQEKIDAQLAPLVSTLNSSTTKGRSGTLVLQPRIDNLKFISTGERILGGAMVGGSAISMTLEMTEAETGRKIASPAFYQHANAFGSSYSFGTTDRDMLNRVVRLMADYVTANAEKLAGGPSGADKD